jgi:hypothetical protein
MTLYSFRLQGHVDPRWRVLFDGFRMVHEFTPDQQPVTVMTGPIPDQSALYGILSRLRNMGAALISFQPVEADGTGD